MINFEMIQDYWFYYAALFCVSFLIGSIKLFNKVWYNIALFIVLILLEVIVCNWIGIGYFYPTVLALVVFLFFTLKDFNPGNCRYRREDSEKAICLPVLSGVRGRQLQFYYYYANFLVYGGAGSGKTKSIGKWLLQEYIRLGFAGFIYDFKDIDYTRTAYNLMKKYNYKGEFFYINFDNLSRSFRFNPLKNVSDKTVLMQLMEDMLLSMQAKDAKQDEWFAGGLGILRGVAYRLYDEYREYCTIPHILTLIMNSSQDSLTRFLEQNTISEMMAGAFLKAKGSEKTQASYISTLSNQIWGTERNVY